MAADPLHINLTRTAQKTPLRTVTSLLRVKQPLPSNGCLSGSKILALRKYAKMRFIIRFCVARIVDKPIQFRDLIYFAVRYCTLRTTLHNVAWLFVIHCMGNTQYNVDQVLDSISKVGCFIPK
jgi:hypothetical protein